MTQQILSETLRQTDFATAAPEVDRYGCHAWVHALAAELRAGVLFSIGSFLAALAAGRLKMAQSGDEIKPVVGEFLLLNNPGEWAQLCLDALAPGRFRVWQNGTDGGWFAGQRWYSGPVTEAYTYLSLCWRRPPYGRIAAGERNYHYFYLDPYNGIVWDPHGRLARPLSPVWLPDDGPRICSYLVQEIA